MAVLRCHSNVDLMPHLRLSTCSHFGGFAILAGTCSSRASLLRSGQWWLDAQRQSASTLCNGRWDMFSPTEANATLIFRILTQVQASTYDLLLLRCRQYPLKLVDLLATDPADLEIAILEFLSSPSCRLD
eukprot:632497-Amphidinium_carterae.2